MCCTSGNANLYDTILYAHQIVKDEKLVHILGYQNSVENLEPGPNAMILPLPAKSTLGPDNIIDTTEYKECLIKMARIVANNGRRMTKSATRSFSVQVFESGEYTVILSKDSSLISQSLQVLPVNKRPNISKEILKAYTEWYPDWPIAVCCFEATEMEASPLLWWYEPIDSSRFFLPALDGHGKTPDLNEKVTVDHTLIIGSNAEHAYLTKHDIHIDNLIKYNTSVENNINQIKQYLPSKILGRKIEGRYKNGDFYVTTKENGNLKIDRLNPTETMLNITGE